MHILGVILGVLLLIGGGCISTYNGLKSAYIEVGAHYGQVENQIQRRAGSQTISTSATMVLMTTLASAMDMEEPRERNSNLLPVNAKGEVRFLSVVSFGNFGSTCTPIVISVFSRPL